VTVQDSLFDQPQLLPNIPGCIQGVVGKRTTADGKYEWDVQCQRCYDIETPRHLIMMTYQFPACQEPRRRLCPSCHQNICDGNDKCRGMSGMRGHYD